MSRTDGATGTQDADLSRRCLAAMSLAHDVSGLGSTRVVRFGVAPPVWRLRCGAFGVSARRDRDEPDDGATGTQDADLSRRSGALAPPKTSERASASLGRPCAGSGAARLAGGSPGTQGRPVLSPARTSAAFLNTRSWANQSASARRPVWPTPPGDGQSRAARDGGRSPGLRAPVRFRSRSPGSPRCSCRAAHRIRRRPRRSPHRRSPPLARTGYPRGGA